MKQEDVNKAVIYWQETSKHSYETMNSLFKSKRYSDSLFFGHIILEKIIKALVLKKTKEEAPKTHDLVRLQELADLKLEIDTVKLLKEINGFNIKARYPDYKFKFHKLCTKEFTKEYLDKIIPLYKELCQKLKQKK